MRILITGVAGYIGSVTAALLVGAGHEVIGVDNLSHGHRDAVPEGVQFIECNVGELATRVAENVQIDAVVHLAAYIAAGESMTIPEVYWQNNTVNTLSLLNFMRNRGVKKLVFASTAATYGNPTEIPITEDSATKPTSTYGMTKLAIDMAITSESWAHGLAAASLRFFNVAGAYGEYGERHPVETHIIPLIFEAASGKRDAFTIFGDDYDTPDGTCIRDYIHVYDLALAIQKSLDAVKPGSHRIYNLANGKGFSNKEVVAAVQSVTGKQFPVNFGARREGDPAVLIASSKRAEEELGWIPTHPNLNDMIKDAWVFYQARESH